MATWMLGNPFVKVDQTGLGMESPDFKIVFIGFQIQLIDWRQVFT
jgi:hypothetical protein